MKNNGWLFVSCVFLFSLLPNITFGQGFELAPNVKRDKIPFKMFANTIIVQMTINDKGPYNFILDTGAGLTLITDAEILDTTTFTTKNYIKVRGITQEDFFTAIMPEPQRFKIGNAESFGLSPAVLTDQNFGISNYAGLEIHGILGFDFFNSFKVSINFDSNIITILPKYRSKRVNSKRIIPIEFNQRKPYIKTRIFFQDQSHCNCLLMIDTGGGYPILLEDDSTKKWPTITRIPSNLGVGLTGALHGEVGRVLSITLGKNELKNPIAFFPNNILKKDDGFKREGTLGLQVLTRFNLYFDYSLGQLILRPRKNFDKSFEHDLSGIEFYMEGSELAHLVIGRVAKDSPADLIGLLPGDRVVKINEIPIQYYNLDLIQKLFNNEDGKQILLEIDRNLAILKYTLTLKRRI